MKFICLKINKIEMMKTIENTNCVTSKIFLSVMRLKNLISFLGRKKVIKQKVKVTFSEAMKNQPVLWQVARDFDVSLNVQEGLLTEKIGWFIIQIEGQPDEIKRVLIHLKQKGGKLSFPKLG